MWYYTSMGGKMLKHLGGLLLVSAFLVSCQDKEAERQKILEQERQEERQQVMAEIERLDLLRQKADEFLPEQEAALLAKMREYTKWKKGFVDRLEFYEGSIRMTEMTLGDLEGYIVMFKKKVQNERIRGEIRETQKEVGEYQKRLLPLRQKHSRIKKEMDEQEPVYLKQIAKLERDLRTTKATYDSLNTLHTTEVGKLAKFGSEQ